MDLRGGCLGRAGDALALRHDGHRGYLCRAGAPIVCARSRCNLTHVGATQKTASDDLCVALAVIVPSGVTDASTRPLERLPDAVAGVLSNLAFSRDRRRETHL